MGATFIVDDLKLAPVLFDTDLGRMEGSVGLAAREGKKIWCDMASTENRTQVARMVAQWFTQYATAA